MILITLIYSILIIIIFKVANDIFNTALYVYATKGKIPSEYNRETLKNAFKQNLLCCMTPYKQHSSR